MTSTSDIITQLETLMESMCFDAIDIAEQYCDARQGKASCAHYHGIRFLLHQLGARTTLPCQYEVFYTDLKSMLDKAASKQDTLRVLISGAADFIVPALVSFALREVGVAAELIIIDRCLTPLKLCREAARRFGFDWQTQQADIVDLHFDARFDLIVTDRLIGHIPADIRPVIFDKWATLLSSEGLFVTMVTLRPGGKSSPRETRALINKLQDIEERYQADERYPLPVLEKMISSYVSTRSSHPIRDLQSLQAMFGSSPLKIKTIKAVATAHHPIKGKDSLSLIKLTAQRG